MIKSLIFLIFSLLVFSSQIDVITVEGGIGPGISDYIQESIDESVENKTELLVIKLNTPGGLLQSTREIVTNILESKIPIAVFVTPAGAHAGSAGVFITLSAHIAAMNDASNMGSAHPVTIGGGGGDSSSNVMMEKVTNDTKAWVRTICEKRNRPSEWAEDAVESSISATSKELLELGVIDYTAKDLDDLLNKVNGKIISLPSGTYSINTNEAEVFENEMDLKFQFMSFFSDPNVAYILVLITIYGFIIEFKNPGLIFPSVIAGISAILAAYSFNLIPINYIGLILIIISAIMFIVDVFVTSYGLLSIGGLISFVAGSFMLVDSTDTFFQISTSTIVTATILLALLFGFILWFAFTSQRTRKSTGMEGMIGEDGICTKEITNLREGEVKVMGERWKAKAKETIQIDDQVKVIKINGLKLEVEKASI